jgi:hypothetical protein
VNAFRFFVTCGQMARERRQQPNWLYFWLSGEWKR